MNIVSFLQSYENRSYFDFSNSVHNELEIGAFLRT